MNDRCSNLEKALKETEGRVGNLNSRCSIAETLLKETEVRLESDNKFEQNIAKLEKEQIIIKEQLESQSAKVKEINDEFMSSSQNNPKVIDSSQSSTRPNETSNNTDHISNSKNVTWHLESNSPHLIGSKKLWDILILMDSNRKNIFVKYLFPGKTVKTIPSGNIEKAKRIISDPFFLNAKGIILHFGVNDIEDESIPSYDAAYKISEVANETKAKFPMSEIFISEITPRMDRHQPSVTEVNTYLNDLVLRDRGSYHLISHENLNQRKLYVDAKHLSKKGGTRELVRN